jgi:hypothetical protein
MLFQTQSSAPVIDAPNSTQSSPPNSSCESIIMEWEFGRKKTDKPQPRNPKALFSVSVVKVKQHDHHEYDISVLGATHGTRSIVRKRFQDITDLYHTCREEIPSSCEIFDSKKTSKEMKAEQFLNLVLERHTISKELQQKVASFLSFEVSTPLFSSSDGGWLFKNARKGVMKGANWTKRLFQLEASKLQLQYFEDTDTSVFKIIQLSPGDTCSEETRVSDKPEYQCFFKIHHESGESSELAAQSEADRNHWMSEIRSICVSSCCFDFDFVHSVLQCKPAPPGFQSRVDCPFVIRLLLVCFLIFFHSQFKQCGIKMPVDRICPNLAVCFLASTSVVLNVFF